ncbi:MAG TPA: cell division protein FtsA [Gemmatimonadetes bacterium]|nr:cell division protein FtsA [Gemmatimonadota bacterium]
MNPILIASVDLGTTKTCAVIAEVPQDPILRREINILGVGQARTVGMQEVITHIDETTESIRAALAEAELMAGVEVDRVYVGIRGDKIQAMMSPGIVAVQGDEISRHDIERVHEVARAVAFPPDRELIHAIPQEYIVDGQRGIKDPVGMRGTRLEAELYLVTVAALAAENIRRSVHRAGYQVEDLILEPLAAARSVLTVDEKEVGVALEIGDATTNIAAYFDGEIRHLAVLPLGGVTVTNDLVQGLSIPFAEAKKTKEMFGVACSQMVDPKEMIELPGLGGGQTRQIARELIAHVIEARMDELLVMAPLIPRSEYLHCSCVTKLDPYSHTKCRGFVSWNCSLWRCICSSGN